MIREIKEHFIKKRLKKGQFGGLVPIMRCEAFRTGMDPEAVKRIIARKMEKEIANYIYFDAVTQDDGTTLLRGRIDVLRRDMPDG